MKYPNNPAGLKTFLDALKRAAPSIAFSILRQHDPFVGPIHKEYDGFTAEEADDWQAWQSEVTASTLIGGDLKAGRYYLGRYYLGRYYLGGTFERADDIPEESNPFISGYLPYMIASALDDLAAQIGNEHADEIAAARQVAQACRLT